MLNLIPKVIPQVTIRYGTQFFRDCYSRDAWTAGATLKLPQVKWRERHCVCFDFVLQQIFVLRSQPSFFSAWLSIVLCSFGCSLFGCQFAFREFIQLNFNGNGNDGCVSLRCNPLFISLPLFTKGPARQATFFSNVSRNIVALQVETHRCSYYHFVANLFRSKIQCCKLRRRVEKSRLEFYFKLQILILLLVLPLKAGETSTCLATSLNLALVIGQCGQRRRARSC